MTTPTFIALLAFGVLALVAFFLAGRLFERWTERHDPKHSALLDDWKRSAEGWMKSAGYWKARFEDEHEAHKHTAAKGDHWREVARSKGREKTW